MNASLFSLSDIPTSALRAELRRREDEDDATILPCDECRHFKAFNGNLDATPPHDYNPCSRGHVMRFQTPQTANPHDAPWGFHRPGCRDRKARPRPRAINEE